MYHMLHSAHSSLQSDSIGIAPTHWHQAQLRIYILTQTNTCNRFDLEFEPILFAYKRHKIFWLGVFFFFLALYIKTHSHTHPAISQRARLQSECECLRFSTCSFWLMKFNYFTWANFFVEHFYPKTVSHLQYWFWHGNRFVCTMQRLFTRLAKIRNVSITSVWLAWASCVYLISILDGRKPIYWHSMPFVWGGILIVEPPKNQRNNNIPPSIIIKMEFNGLRLTQSTRSWII